MSPIMLRQLWSVVETTQSATLLNLDDSSLVQWLMKQIRNRHCLNHEETAIVNTYIRSHLPLIRDLAGSRGVVAIQ